MNILDIDFDKYNPIFVDVFSEIYGEEYRSIIEERINNTIHINYNNSDGVERYYNFLIACKEHELFYKFFEQIGITKRDENIRYSEGFNEKFVDLIYKYFGFNGINVFAPTFMASPSGIRSFDKIKIENDEELKIQKAQIACLNRLRDSDKKITRSNYYDFQQTEEYKYLMHQISQYLDVYHKLYDEMKEYCDTIQVYKDFVDSEEEREKELLKMKKCEIYLAVKKKIPHKMKKFLDEKFKNIWEKSNLFEIDKKAYIEYFSSKDELILNENILYDAYETHYQRKYIYHYRLKYLQQLGVCDLPEDFNLNLEDMKDKYNNLIQKEDVKKVIPSFDLVEKISNKRREKSEEVDQDFIYKSETFQKNILKLCNNESCREFLYSKIRKKAICVSGAYDNGGFRPILSFTVNSSGYLDYLYLHELTHVIESTPLSFESAGYICGFESMNSESRNPYNSSKRIYERMNETFADIFANEAKDKLHQRGIYFAEAKELTIEDTYDINTDSILKKMVAPLLERFRPEIIEARISGKKEVLSDVIGTDNFEDLNDAVNKVDYLLDQGLKFYLEDNIHDNSIVSEYKEQLLRVEEIYKAIDTRVSMKNNSNFNSKH